MGAKKKPRRWVHHLHHLGPVHVRIAPDLDIAIDVAVATTTDPPSTVVTITRRAGGHDAARLP